LVVIVAHPQVALQLQHTANRNKADCVIKNRGAQQINREMQLLLEVRLKTAMYRPKHRRQQLHAETLFGNRLQLTPCRRGRPHQKSSLKSAGVKLQVVIRTAAQSSMFSASYM
jgi:hypothetical protein